MVTVGSSVWHAPTQCEQRIAATPLSVDGSNRLHVLWPWLASWLNHCTDAALDDAAQIVKAAEPYIARRLRNPHLFITSNDGETVSLQSDALRDPTLTGVEQLE